MYKTAKEIKEIYNITSQTLYNWRKNNQIDFIKLPSGRYMYVEINKKNHKLEKMNVIYARVSNTKQKNDLERQITYISSYMVKNGYKVDKIYKDIASGMNGNRKEFNLLIDDVLNGKINKVFISYKDRLIRFGYDIIENIFKKNMTKIECINLTKEEDFQTELTEDLISIIQHFSMKLYSKRRLLAKNFKKEIENIV